MEQDKSNFIKNYILNGMDETKELLENLGKIPAPSHHEDRRAQFCKRWFLSQGAQHVIVDDAKNVVCEINCENAESIAVFMAHMDTVFEDEKEFSVRWENERLYAPGIGDDTANLVNLMMTYKYLKKYENNLKKGILIVANSCEEGLGNLDGCKEIFKNYGERIDEFYSFDGYISQCTNRPVGSYRYKIDVKVTGGHSYADFGRKNAIVELSNIIQELYEIAPPKDEKTTYNVGKIEGGSTVNSIAEHACMLYEFRSESQKCLKEMKDKFYETISKHKKEDVEVKVEVIGIRPGSGWRDKEKLVKWTKKNVNIIKSCFDGELDLKASSTDANIPLSKGVFANTIGTVIGGLAHTENEWIDFSSMKIGQEIAIRLVSQYLDRQIV